MTIVKENPQVIPRQNVEGAKIVPQGSKVPSPSFSESITRSQEKTLPKQGMQGQDKPQLKEAPPGVAPSANELDSDVMFAILQAKISKITRDTIKTQIENNFKLVEANSKEIIKKLDEHIEKMENVKEQSLASKVLGWLGASLSIVVGVAAMIAGGAGVGLIVAGVAAMTIMTLEETGVMAKAQKALGEAIEKSLIKNGMDAEEAKQKAGIIATVTLTVATVVATVGPAFINAGGGAVKASLEIQKVARTASIVAKGVSGGSMISSGGVGISTSKDQRDAQMKEVEAAALRAIVALLKDENSDLVKDMGTLNQVVSQSYTIAMDIINAQIKTQKNVVESMKSNA